MPRRHSCTCCSVRDQSADSGPTTGVAAWGDNQRTRADHQGTGRASSPGVPRCAARAVRTPEAGTRAQHARRGRYPVCPVRTARRRRVRVARTYGTEGPGAHVSAQVAAESGGGKHESAAGVAVDAAADRGGSSGDAAGPVRGQEEIIRPAAPHRRTTAAPPRHRTAPHVQGKGRAGPGPQTCGVARGAYAKGEAGARSAAVLQVSAIQAHALGGVLLVVHDEPPLPQREAPRHLRTAAARRRGRPLEGRRLERVGRRRVVWTRRCSLGLGLRAAIHPCARQHLPQQRGRQVALLSPWPLARTRQARDGGTSARRRMRAR